jgi:hypothetical protein
MAPHWYRRASTPIERTLGVGEKNAAITVALEPVPPAAPQEGAPERATREPPTRDQPASSSDSGVPTASIVVGSVGVIALGVAVGFGVSAGSDYRALEKDCAPGCSSGQTEGVSRKARIADIARATGAVALGAALWIYFDRDDSRAVAIGISPTPTGPQGRLRASF